MTRVLNISIRLATLNIRFVFIFFLAKYLSAGSLGYYGIFAATIAYGMIFVGLEFFLYTTREILSVPPEEQGGMLKGHAALIACLYISMLPIVMTILAQVGWPRYLYLLFIPILFLEHFNQEIYRILIAKSQTIAASLLLFARQASWAIVAIIAMVLSVAARSLEIIVICWLVSGVITAILGIWTIRQIEISGWRNPINWHWVRKGVLVAAPFLFATLAQRGIFTFDRYWLEALGGVEIVAAYVLFFGLASALSVFVDAAIVSFIYPELIKHSNNGEFLIAREKTRTMLYQVLGVSVAFAILSWILLPYLLGWIDNPSYYNFAGLFPWVLSGMILYVVGLVPHWALYARGKDRAIVLSNLMAFAMFMLTTWATNELLGIYAVLVAVNASLFFSLTWKYGAYRQTTKFEGVM